MSTREDVLLRKERKRRAKNKLKRKSMEYAQSRVISSRDRSSSGAYGADGHNSGSLDDSFMEKRTNDHHSSNNEKDKRNWRHMFREKKSFVASSSNPSMSVYKVRKKRTNDFGDLSWVTTATVMGFLSLINVPRITGGRMNLCTIPTSQATATSPKKPLRSSLNSSTGKDKEDDEEKQPTSSSFTSLSTDYLPSKSRSSNVSRSASILVKESAPPSNRTPSLDSAFTERRYIESKACSYIQHALWCSVRSIPQYPKNSREIIPYRGGIFQGRFVLYIIIIEARGIEATQANVLFNAAITRNQGVVYTTSSISSLEQKWNECFHFYLNDNMDVITVSLYKTILKGKDKREGTCVGQCSLQAHRFPKSVYGAYYPSESWENLSDLTNNCPTGSFIKVAVQVTPEDMQPFGDYSKVDTRLVNPSQEFREFTSGPQLTYAPSVQKEHIIL